MSGELGFYAIVEGNMGDRNDLNLWYDGSSLVCVSIPFPLAFLFLTQIYNRRWRVWRPYATTPL